MCEMFLEKKSSNNILHINSQGMNVTFIKVYYPIKETYYYYCDKKNSIYKFLFRSLVNYNKEEVSILSKFSNRQRVVFSKKGFHTDPETKRKRCHQ